MDIKQDVSKALAILRHPGRETSWNASPKEALKFYYRIAILATVLSIVAGIASSFAFGHIATATTGIFYTVWLSLFGGNAVVAIVAYSVFYYLLFFPASIAADTLVFQAFGRLLKRFKMPIGRTFVASVMATVPGLLFGWMLIIPYVGLAADAVIVVLTLIVLFYAISRQQQIDMADAFLVWIIAGIIIGVVLVAVLILAFVLGFFNIGGPQASSLVISNRCVATAGYYCGTPNVSSSGLLSFGVGENLGSMIYNVTVAVSPINATYLPVGFPATAFVQQTRIPSLAAGQIINAGVAVPLNYRTGNYFFGDVWLNYSVYPGGPSITSVKIGRISAKG